MKVEGTYQVDADIDTVWRLLNDPDVLSRCIPGGQKLTPKGDDTYEAAMNVGIGPVKGNFAGTVKLVDPDPPNSYTLRMEGKGPGAFVNGEGHFVLRELDGSKTEVNVSGEAQVGGMFARVGQRMIGNASRTLMNQFFDNLKKEAKKA